MACMVLFHDLLTGIERARAVVRRFGVHVRELHEIAFLAECIYLRE